MPKEYGEYDFFWLAAAYVAASVVEHGAMLAFTFAPAFEGGETSKIGRASCRERV